MKKTVKKTPVKKTRVKLSRYDTADYLNTEQDIAAYLEAAIEDAGDDPAFIAHALGTVARSRGMVKLARATGMTREGLYKALSAKGNPSFSTVYKVMRALGVKLTPQAA